MKENHKWHIGVISVFVKKVFQEGSDVFVGDVATNHNVSEEEKNDSLLLIILTAHLLTFLSL